MRAPLALLLAFTIAPAAGCKSSPSGDGGADSAVASDMATTGDFAGSSADLAIPPDAIEVRWFLLTANISGGTNNGFSLACDKAKASKLLFTVMNQATTQKKMTEIACPSGSTDGVALLGLPDTQGPFIFTGVSPDLPSSVGEKIKVTLPLMGGVSLRIYAEGCDAEVCQ